MSKFYTPIKILNKGIYLAYCSIVILFIAYIIFGGDLSFASKSKGNFRVRSIRGAAFCGDKVLKSNELVPIGCQIQTHAQSNIFMTNGENVISFGENAKGEIRGIDHLVLSAGMLRLKLKEGLIIETPQGKSYLKNGDYLSRVSDLFKETELINFNGEIKLESKISTNDFVVITPSHWGGLGGRFGEKIGNLVLLNNEQKKIFKVILD